MAITLIETQNVIKEYPGMTTKSYKGNYVIVSSKIGYICDLSNTDDQTAKITYRTTLYTVNSKDGMRLLFEAILRDLNTEGREDAVNSFYDNINTKRYTMTRPLLKYIQDYIIKHEESNYTVVTEYSPGTVNTYIEWKNQSADKIIRLTNTGEITTNISEFRLTEEQVENIQVEYYRPINTTIRALLEVVKKHINYADERSDDIEGTKYQYLDFIEIVDVIGNTPGATQLLNIQKVLDLPEDTLLSTIYCDYPDIIDINIQAPYYENKCSQMLFREVLCREFGATRYTTKVTDQSYYNKYGENRRLYQVVETIDDTEYMLTYRVDFWTNSDYDAQNKIIMLNITKGQPNIMENYKILNNSESNTRY